MAIKEIKLNAQNFDTLKKFAMVQGDSARVLRCFVDIDLSTVKAARIYIKKADGTEIYNDCTVHDEYIDAPLTTQALAVVGDQVAQLHITDGNGYITTYKFIIEVLKSYVSGSAIESSSEFTALENALSTSESLQDQIGDLSGLETTAKDNLVEAINEAKESGGGVTEPLPTPIAFTPTKSGVTNWLNGGNSWYYKVGTKVHVHIGVQGLTANTNNEIFQLPSGYRPYSIVACMGVGGSSYTAYTAVNVSTNGIINVYGNDTYGCVDIEYDAYK